jgi:3-keto-5-aminohexanoate cleavage enzyme
MEWLKDVPIHTTEGRPGDEKDFHDAIAATWPWKIPEEVVIKLASIGSIFKKTENPHQPLLPHENLKAVMDSIEAGASGIHFNATGPQGERTGGIEAYKALLEPCREKYGYRFVADCNVLFGKTIEDQLAPLIAGLAETICSAMYQPRKFLEAEARLMLEKNCKFEMVIHCSAEVELAHRILIKPGLVKKPYAWQILIGVPSRAGRLHEYMPNPRAMCESLLMIVNRIKEIDEDAFIIVCQSGRATKYLTTLAMLLGLHVRVGTEDTMWRHPHKEEIIKDNAEVIREHVAMAKLLGRRVATGNEYRKLIGLPER